MTCQLCRYPLTHHSHDRMDPSWLIDDWSEYDDEPVTDEPDWVVIDRLIAGTPVASTTTERAEAVRRMTAMGLTIPQIAARMHCSERAVDRYRAKVRAA